MHHIYYSKEKFIETDGKAVFIIYHLPKMEGAKRMSEQTYMYEQATAVPALHQEEGIDPRSTTLKTLVIGAEPHTDEQRKKIERMLGVKAA